MKACYCNKAGHPRCCVLDCESPNTVRGGCWPCHCWRGTERCLQTGQKRKDKEDRNGGH